MELTPHVLKRMQDRRFSEVELRTMLDHASSYHPDVEEGRWAIVSLIEAVGGKWLSSQTQTREYSLS